MASPFQKHALQRKIAYMASILVLFTLAWFWRHYQVDVQASDLAIREVNRGDVELSGSVVRLTLTGSRGLATCALWMAAIDKQKKNQWNELELLVRSLTKLQPYFITPWLFQSWNLAYNVSVESDRIRDKYFYISRGIELLAEGEKQNRNHPDLRFNIGFYNQHKICQSDETNTLRSLYQLSCIPPNERDPMRFRVFTDDGRELRWGEFASYLADNPSNQTMRGRIEKAMKEFDAFCKEHPQLMRRLRDGIRRDTKFEQARQFSCESVDAVLQFLAENQMVPSLFEELPASPPNGWETKKNNLKAAGQRFPLLPPPRRVERPQVEFLPGELTHESKLGDEFDAFADARAWYGYSQEPIPPPGDLPGSTSEITDRSRQRKPRQIATLIFRNYPARAQSYIAERLEQEGWYDDSGWRIPGWFEGDNFSDGQPALIGGGREKWSLKSWEDAARMWQDYAEKNHMLFKSADDEANTRRLAAEFRRAANLTEGDMVPDLREESMEPSLREKYHAAKFIKELEVYRQMSNFLHHYNRSRAEANPVAVNCKKLFFNAETERLTDNPRAALEIYRKKECIQDWKDKVLLTSKRVGDKDLRVLTDYGKDSFSQEYTFEVQLKYLNLFDREEGQLIKQQLAQRLELFDYASMGLTRLGLAPGVIPTWIPVATLLAPRPFKDIDLIPGPFDGVDDEGRPFVEDHVQTTVLGRKRLTPKAKPIPPMPPPGFRLPGGAP
ncbi:MAG: hypothetical protein EXR99_11285 [Gemmataceae bacterium]|nr:hypothetical protein [Gemmataceae bacterium]